jgi:hypothetical protein
VASVHLLPSPLTSRCNLLIHNAWYDSTREQCGYRVLDSVQSFVRATHDVFFSLQLTRLKSQDGRSSGLQCVLKTLVSRLKENEAW